MGEVTASDHGHIMSRNNQNYYFEFNLQYDAKQSD